MFKMLMVVCMIGAECVPFYENGNRTYPTEAECLAATETKMVQVTRDVLPDPSVKSIYGGCVPVTE